MGTRLAGSTRPAARLAGLLMVLAGLFAMHGLDTHGMSGTEHAGTGAGAMSMSIGATVVATTHMATRAATQTLPRSADGAAGGFGSDMTMTVLCLAVLVLTAVTLVLELRRRRLATAMAVLPRSGADSPPRGRGPDPPCLLRLSIQRC